MRCRFALVMVFALFGVLACVSTPNAFKDSTPITLLSASHRSLELEPCGCNLISMGGVVREANFQTSLTNRNLVSISSGDTFVPYDSAKSLSESFLKIKRSQFAEALRQLGTKVIAPGEKDSALGVEELKRLEGLSGAAFINANWVDARGERVLKPFYRLTLNRKSSLFFVGLSPLSMGTSETETISYASAVEQALKASNPEEDTVIVLHSLSSNDEKALSARFPQIRFFIGGSQGQTVMGADHWRSPEVFSLVSPIRGRGLGVLELPLDGPKPFLFLAQSADFFKSEVASLKRANSLSAKEKSYLNYVRSFPVEPSDSAMPVNSRFQHLTNEFDSPENALSKLISTFKSQTRGLALSED